MSSSQRPGAAFGPAHFGTDVVREESRVEHSWARNRLFAYGRRLLGFVCLAVTIFLWTASNFLASTIFADNTYSKPYFVTYVNSTFFILPLIPILIHKAYRQPAELQRWKDEVRSKIWGNQYTPAKQEEDGSRASFESMDERALRQMASSQTLLLGGDVQETPFADTNSSAPLTLFETLRLSFEFCFLWSLANYFVSACLQYTTVASSTILTSTSSVFTLLFGALFGVEMFTLRKTLGIGASLAGIVLISTIDMSGRGNDEQHRGDFPEKTPQEMAIGNCLALVSAVMYGTYAVLMKKRIADESRVNMPLFFGLVGVVNLFLLWPGFVLLHYTGIEPFALPPTRRVAVIVLCNSLASLISDMTWAYAVLLTSPLVVTVGLSLTIPISLIGQTLLNRQTAGVWYWVGALMVVVSFLFITHEDEKEDLLRSAVVAESQFGPQQPDDNDDDARSTATFSTYASRSAGL